MAQGAARQLDAQLEAATAASDQLSAQEIAACARSKVDALARRTRTQYVSNIALFKRYCNELDISIGAKLTVAACVRFWQKMEDAHNAALEAEMDPKNTRAYTSQKRFLVRLLSRHAASRAGLDGPPLLPCNISRA